MTDGLSTLYQDLLDMGGVTVLQLAAAHPDCVAAIVMVDPASLVPPPERRATLEAMAAAIETGNHEPLRQFIENMFLTTSDRRLVENIMAVMLTAPDHVAVNAMRGVLEFDGRAASIRDAVLLRPADAFSLRR
jgi:pimeloyl-ACP methyl ester carboxylesterase